MLARVLPFVGLHSLSAPTKSTVEPAHEVVCRLAESAAGEGKLHFDAKPYCVGLPRRA